MSSTTLDTLPCVIDFGAGTLHAGWSGKQQPEFSYRAVVGTPKYPRLLPTAKNDSQFIGSNLQSTRGLLQLSQPIQQGLVSRWEDWEATLDWVESEQGLGCRLSAQPLLLTETLLNPISHKQAVLERLFETFDVRSAALVAPPLLALYASGHTTGLVIDCGQDTTTIAGVHEGYALSPTLSRYNVGGSDITAQFQLLLQRHGIHLHSSAEYEIARDAKHAMVHVAADPVQAEAQVRAGKYEATKYVLPDGTALSLTAECFRAGEVPFQPGLAGKDGPGLHEMVHKAVRSVDMDVRGHLWGNMALVGGGAQLAGLPERLLKELKASVSSEVRLSLALPEGPETIAWQGGSVLTSLSTFSDMCVHASDMAEHGAERIAAWLG